MAMSLQTGIDGSSSAALVRRSFRAGALGVVRVIATDSAIVAIDFADTTCHRRAPAIESSWREPSARHCLIDRAVRELGEYVRGTRRSFSLPLAPQGTAFQRAVWDQLAAIPCGETRTYAEIARAIGRPRAARAVGAANARNPLAIVVPCHRVIGGDGELTGYAGGIDRKRWLLAHESRHPTAGGRQNSAGSV